MNSPFPMKTEFAASRRFAAWLIVMGLALSGCSNVNTVVIKPSPRVASTGTPAPVHVALLLDAEFTGYRWRPAPKGMVYPLGDALRRLAEDVVRSEFRQVTVVPDAAAAVNRADAVLYPRVVKIEQVLPIWAYSERELVIVIEWTLKDRANERVVWLTTVRADATEKAGTAFSMKRHEQALFQRVFDGLAEKSAIAMRESPEIGRLSSTRTDP